MAVKKVEEGGRTCWRARRSYPCPVTGKEKQKTRFRQTKAEAEEADWEIKQQIEVEQRRHRTTGRTNVPTVGEFWKMVIEHAEDRGFDKSTIKNKHRSWRRFGDLIEHHRLDELDEFILDKVRTKVKARCTSIGTARITIDEIRAMLNLAKRWRFIPHVPDLPRISTKEVRAAGGTADDEAASLDADELRRLFQELRASRSPRNFTIASVQFWAATRVGEAMGLRLEDVRKDHIVIEMQWDDEEAEVALRKGRMIHRTAWAEPLFGILDEYEPEVPETGMLFAKADTLRPPRRASYNGALRRAAIRAGISNPERVSSHILRHSAATLVGAETGSELVVQHMLGHTTPVHTRKYIHKKGASVGKAVAALQSAMSRKDHRKVDDLGV